VGAGARGPLVNCCLRAAEKAELQIRCYAIEKNPHAMITLRHIKEETWGDQVTIVHHDMRDWQAPEKADILVSELLGSFGDNELSPECLDGAQRFLKEDGVSIPTSCKAFVTPISSTKLHVEVTSFRESERFETPFVVMFHAVHEMFEPKEVWNFEHPQRDEKDYLRRFGHNNLHNTRYANNTFVTPVSELIHGMGGYFEAVLYGDVLLSIHPKTHSPGMMSWFPIYFPLREPVYAPRGSTLVTHFWRCTDSRKVWYEWALEVWQGEQRLCITSMHNPGGRSSWIGL